MENRKNKAINTFRSGHNCAQAVLTSFSDKTAIEDNLATNISSGFGGGMGKLQLTCGAVTGSFMVIGMHCGKMYDDNGDKKSKSYAMIKEFSKKFTDIHGTLECKGLVKYDLNTPEGEQGAKGNKVFELICEKCISDSVEIVEGLIEK